MSSTVSSPANLRHDASSHPQESGGYRTPWELIHEYIMQRSAIYGKLKDLKQKGWENPQGDRHFQSQRARADHATSQQKMILYKMGSQICSELHDATSALTPASALNEPPVILDLCMAPGGFSACALRQNKRSTVCGISLPTSQGGHTMLLPNHSDDSRIQVCYLDITMLAGEMNVDDIPPGHPDAANFLFNRPFHDQKFDLIFCDGQVLRMHARAEYREKREAWRLLTSQLVLALDRVKTDGTIVALLHKLDAWDTVLLLSKLREVSSLKLFKPVKKHAVRSSFYVVAENIQPESPRCQALVAEWKREWRIATFGSDDEYEQNRSRSDNAAAGILADFGPDLIRLGEPIWEIQNDALSRSSFVVLSKQQ